MFKSKKAQIMVFIILAIVLAALSFMFLYFKDRFVQEVIGERGREIVQDVPSDLRPFYNYFVDCLDDVSLKAIKKIGTHGGYIDMNILLFSGETFYFDKDDPTNSDGIFLGEESEPVPYWWYLKSPNTCTDCLLHTNAPIKEHIEYQIEAYLLLALDTCLQDFVPFKKQGYEVKSTANYEMEVILAERSVEVFANVPLEISKGNIRSELSQFYTSINLDMLQFLELASLITLFESEFQPLEYATTQLLTYYSGLDFNKLPPFYGMEESYLKITWNKLYIEQQLKDLFMTYFPFIKIKGTKNSQTITSNDPIEQRFYDVLSFNISDINYSNLKVDFYYLGWPIYFDIFPRNGAILSPSTVKSEGVAGLFPSTPTHTYEFFYDISFPVLVKITDDSALNGEGYSFMFALETNIRANKNLQEWHLGRGTLAPWDETMNVDMYLESDPPDLPESIPSDVLDSTSDYGEEFDEGIVLDEVGSTIDSLMDNTNKNLFCDSTQQLTGEIIISTNDISTGEPLSGVDISYGCGDYNLCSLGTTSSTEFNAILETKMPLCVGGYLKFEFIGQETEYVTHYLPFSTYQDMENHLSVGLEPVRYLTPTIKKMEMTGINELDEEKKPLEDSDLVILTIMRVPDLYNPLVDSLTQSVFIDMSGGNVVLNDIKLVPGEYEVTAMYINNEGFVIPQFCKHICQGPGCPLIKELVADQGVHPDEATSKCLAGALAFMFVAPLPWYTACTTIVNKWVPEEDVDVIPSPSGGVYLNNETDYWHVSRSDLDSANGNVEFYILNTPNPTCLDSDCVLPECIGMEEMDKTLDYSREFKNKLKPKFI